METSGKQEARRLVATGRLREAIRLYEAHLELHDEDHEARLEYGLVCLMDGDRDRFIQVGMEYQPCMSPTTLERLGGRIRTLWREYAASCARFAAASAIGASVVVACGCNDKPARPEAKQETTQVEAPVVTETEATPDASTTTPDAVEKAPPAEDEVAAAEEILEETQKDATDEPDEALKKKDKDKGKKKPPHHVIKNRYVAVHLDLDENDF